MLKLTRHLFSWQSLPEYSAYYERAVFNHILASQNPDDGMCTYYTPLISGGKKGYLSPFSIILLLQRIRYGKSCEVW